MWDFIGLDKKPDSITFIEGGAKGADFLTRVWVKYRQIETDYFSFVEYPADWKTYGKRAGHIRNAQMLNEGKPDLVIAFPGGRGTQDMVDKATHAGVPVLEVSNDS